MLHLALADIVQVRPPFQIVLKVFSDVLGKEDVPGISTIHHPLCDVDTRPRNVGALIHIRDLVHRAAVNPHADLEFRVILKRLTNL